MLLLQLPLQVAGQTTSVNMIFEMIVFVSVAAAAATTVSWRAAENARVGHFTTHSRQEYYVYIVNSQLLMRPPSNDTALPYRARRFEAPIINNSGPLTSFAQSTLTNANRTLVTQFNPSYCGAYQLPIIVHPPTGIGLQ